MSVRSECLAPATKSIAYGYPSSGLARRLLGSRRGDAEGVYAIEIWRSGRVVLCLGPFATVADAERAADRRPEPWSDAYRNHPRPGSKFHAAGAAS